MIDSGEETQKEGLTGRSYASGNACGGSRTGSESSPYEPIENWTVALWVTSEKKRKYEMEKHKVLRGRFGGGYGLEAWPVSNTV